ncbi:hypothetical protein ASPZODRAFT_152461 [Penicilliopsis zonata CBS 506.65]|uniref:Yeast cell wall synthesis Kre9/Knh1-like N-terminal domain-containing protein n=1 Tax=Penicilliopsis zonata CBS 506.65 TaxID=1073090 RepID=A0A1L9SGJ2_9EURO|nr:hypothetical protein ASPZODRAFT_152461 [Penicilliopsis zonata CBS 506.65]OJJ46276.1 hypothetical protein ASPZODRAFT_152461 [Penicilliopsis zonata CBS 506.65]
MRANIISVAVSTLATVVAATSDASNPFNVPSGGYSFTAGTPTTITWEPTTSGTISLILEWGDVLEVEEGITLASGISNSGSYVWTPSADIPVESDYSIEIIDDADTSLTDYMPRFTIAGVTGTVSTTATSTASSTKSTSSASTSSSSSTNTLITTTASANSTATVSSTGPVSAKTSSVATATAASTTAAAASTAATSGSASASSTTVPDVNGGMATRVSGGLLALALAVAALF